MIFAREPFANWRTSHPWGTAREYADEMVGIFSDRIETDEAEYEIWKKLVSLAEAAH